MSGFDSLDENWTEESSLRASMKMSENAKWDGTTTEDMELWKPTAQEKSFKRDKNHI